VKPEKVSEKASKGITGTEIDNRGSWLNHLKKQTKTDHMAKITFKPNEDRILVEPAEAETKTASGLYIPDTAKEKPQKGKVVAVGEGIKDKPVTVKVGDQILYGKYSGTEITIDGKEYLIMRNSDIFGTI
jgi:chaperonin GroES